MDLGSRVDTLMDGLTADPERLTAIPSAAFPGSSAEPVRRAEPNPRFHPERDAEEALGLLVTHLEAPRPSGIPLTVTPHRDGSAA
ncbi:hypothetical protein [Streptomyces sp. ITFR-6]|uniref:hypothetical protein n=1 Tax=Streptomyces sp. ITFR-6 TaxID=3075197 RepID=UPI002889DE4B|nr:hypothetical protein [Streptomyces sp. ITFR-6]WNI28319.1 hypothetical protein RLT59_05655 [Streptomyces sp. ITFR-6]